VQRGRKSGSPVFFGPRTLVRTRGTRQERGRVRFICSGRQRRWTPDTKHEFFYNLGNRLLRRLRQKVGPSRIPADAVLFNQSRYSVSSIAWVIGLVEITALVE
jgi:hypothetical protein